MPGRNDPCPCGSGKKYKHCCLKKDEAARHAALEEAERAAREPKVAPPLFSLPTPLRFPSEAGKGDEPFDELEQEADADDSFWDEPETRPDSGADFARYEARWEEFEAAETCEEQIAIFLASLDDGLMDDENAFAMLDAIYEATAAGGERERFDPLVALLRQRLPEIYAQEAHFYLDWLISNALAAGRLDALPALADELADTAGEHLETIIRVFDQLAYHGQLPVLAAAVRRAWPQVRDGGGYFDWAVSEFAERGMTIAMLDYCEHSASPNAAELEALGAYFDCTIVRPGGAARFLAHITGQAGHRWTLDDLHLPTRRRRKGESESPADDGGANLYDLTVEFLGYLRREEGVSYAKGELARDQIERYLLERHAGELKDENRPRKARKREAQPLAATPAHLLCPDRASLDRYLVDLLNFLSPRPYRAAALFEMIPAWLRFLEVRELIDAAQRERTLSDLSSLVPTLIEFWGHFAADPELQRATARWP